MFIQKITLITFLALSMQPIIQAYDAIMLKDQVAAIAKYAQELRTENDPQALQLATWLEDKIADTANTTDNDIAAMKIMVDRYESKRELQAKMLRYVTAILLSAVAGSTILGGMWLKFRNDWYVRSTGWH